MWAESMAFEGEPVDLEMLEEEHARRRRRQGAERKDDSGPADSGGD